MKGIFGISTTDFVKSYLCLKVLYYTKRWKSVRVIENLHIEAAGLVQPKITLACVH